MPVPEEVLPGPVPAEPTPGDRTFAELDALLDRAAAEVQRGLEEGAVRVGRYTLVTPVGEGGFGTVWLASQEEPVRRIVAVKMFRRDPSAGMVFTRFENERQTLARMDHPNVATVLDAGLSEDGRPWFAMPFIDGLPITQLCDERRMGLRDRLRLFAEVCDGVQHAHQKGVIHRDIKPGNILVGRGDRPTPKVIDFGVAKALDAGSEERPRTADGQRLGTPQYMPPEQWLHGAAMADVRSDVYALGVVLGELLAGGPPSRLPRGPLDVPEAIPPVAWLQSVRDRDPAAAAAIAAARAEDTDSLAGRLRGDLDAIVRRATAVRPDERYPSAAALAEDLRRWLGGFPVSARVLNPGQQLWRIIRRHRAVAALLLVAVVAVVTVAAVWATSVAAERRSRDLAEAAELSSERNFRIARTTIDELVERARTDRDTGFSRDALVRVEGLVDTIAKEDPITAGRLAALVAKGHFAAWQNRAGYELLERSFDRVLDADPRGTTVAFHELLPEVTRMAARFDRPVARLLAPEALGRMVAERGMADPQVQEFLRLLSLNWSAWPFYSDRQDPESALAGAQWMTAVIPDPVAAGRALALARISALMRRDAFPGQLEEIRAAVEYLRGHLPADDPKMLLAESSLHTVRCLKGDMDDRSLAHMQDVCARMERVFGTGASQVVNAHWNLAYGFVNHGDYRQGHATFLRFLWPEYRRQSPRDGLRPWYLAYFAPVAYRACDEETAYLAAVTQLNDAAESGRDLANGNSLLSARVLAAVLADWGDEDGARDVERRYGVTRLGKTGGW